MGLDHRQSFARIPSTLTSLRQLQPGTDHELKDSHPSFRVQAGRDASLAKLDAKIPEWLELARRAGEIKFVSYHSHWPYFAQLRGLA
jgi:hypothetical protein